MATSDIRGKVMLYETRSEVLEMLESRGYNIDNYRNYTQEQINIQFEQQTNKYLITSEVGPLDILVENNKKEKIFVKYRLDNKFKKSKSLDQQIDGVYSDILKETDTLVIILVSRVLSNNKDSNVYQYVQTIHNKKNYYIQFFGLENFTFNPTKHAIVPKHIIINDKEEKELLKQYNIADKKFLPLILREDPIAKYIGIKPGQICKIMGKSFNAMYATKYRLCVN